jgi:tetratricopeptide (TPR) repeat protein
MKKTVFSLALLATSLIFAQKSEVKDAEDALEVNDFGTAITLLKKAEPMKSELNDRWLSEFYLLKGKAYKMKAFSGNNTLEDIEIAAKAYNNAIKIGRDVEEANKGLKILKQDLINSAIEDQKKGENLIASDKLYKSYTLNKKDTMYLYYAASAAVQAQKYDKAIDLYNQLMDLGYRGIKTQYIATNVETGKEETFQTKDMRDFSVKSEKYINPKDEVTKSVRGEIAKNMTLIYIQQDETEKALEAIAEAKKESPDDLEILQAEADLYYRLGNIEKYNQIMKQVVNEDPDNPTLYYNLGVSAEQLGDLKGAREYYEKAIELDPKLENAYVNLATATLAKEKELVEQMNKLGTSPADNKKYQELNKKRKKYYSEALPYLEKVVEINPKNLNALRTLMNIYYQLAEDEKAKKINSQIKELTGE